MKWEYIAHKSESKSGFPFIKGTRIGVAAIWSAVLDSKMDFDFVADDFGLPLKAVKEAYSFCEKNKERLEADIEQFRRELAAPRK